MSRPESPRPARSYRVVLISGGALLLVLTSLLEAQLQPSTSTLEPTACGTGRITSCGQEDILRCEARRVWTELLYPPIRIPTPFTVQECEKVGERTLYRDIMHGTPIGYD